VGNVLSLRSRCSTVPYRTSTSMLPVSGAEQFGFESIQQYSRRDNQWPGDIAAWREAGGSHISVVTMGANLTTVDGHIEAIKRWRDVYNSVR
jgi:hypothetical protein